MASLLLEGPVRETVFKNTIPMWRFMIPLLISVWCYLIFCKCLKIVFILSLYPPLTFQSLPSNVKPSLLTCPAPTTCSSNAPAEGCDSCTGSAASCVHGLWKYASPAEQLESYTINMVVFQASTAQFIQVKCTYL